jgi:DNA polymerase III epsilon subunit-like protein
VNKACYAFIDTETTGFDSLRNQVLTLACYVTDEDYNILGEHYGEFRPDGARDIVWSDDAEKVHGISWERAMSFPSLKDSCSQFIDFIKAHGELTFVAHNMPYDRRMLKGTFCRVDGHFDLYQLFPKHEDTIKLLKDAGLISGKSKSLGGVCKELGIEHNHHDARSDAFVLIEIHKRCKQKKNMGNDALLVTDTVPLEIEYEY